MTRSSPMEITLHTVTFDCADAEGNEFDIVAA